MTAYTLAHAQPIVDAAIFHIVKASSERCGGPHRAVSTLPATFAMSNVGGIDGKPTVVFGWLKFGCQAKF